ncbi:MAG: alpha/beta hydrolase [Candidatus Promineofilum sp.]|nr:alpha/beta hydrolase [Promineifilum sp.]
MYEHKLISTNGITLHTVTAGPEDGPLVLLLHGFPEFWYSWRRQIPALAAAGFRVLAPDQRGYNLSDKPRELSAYRLDALAADALGLIDAAGREQAFVVGHDWGAMVAWWLALVAPQRLHHLAILNVPHPFVMRRHLTSDPEQQKRSTYAGFFQLPWLPEAALRAGDWRAAEQAMRGSSRPGTFSDDDMAEYRRAWARPGAMTAMLNWYRALAQRPIADWPSPRVVVPTTIIWGLKDFALRGVMATESAAECDDVELIELPDNTHWVHHEAPELVNETLITRFQI